MNAEIPNYRYQIYLGDYPVVVIHHANLDHNLIKLNAIIGEYKLIGTYFPFGSPALAQTEQEVKQGVSELVYLSQAQGVTVCSPAELDKIIWVEHIYPQEIAEGLSPTYNEKWLLRTVKFANFQLHFSEETPIATSVIRGLVERCTKLAGFDKQVRESEVSIIVQS